MHRFMRVVFLCAALAASPSGALSPHALLHPQDMEGVLPDSIRLRLLATLARGDIPGAIALWQAETGSTAVPKVLQAFQSAFNIANRVAGPCSRVAKDIYEGFKFFGGQPEYVQLSSTGGPYLSWQSRILVSDNNLHSLVRYGGKLYDAFTGPAGMVEAEYLKHLHYGGDILLKTVSSP